MSLGKAMIHARKQKSIARSAAHAGDGAVAQSNHILQMPVLVLNASYEPINICGARRALVLVLKGIARTEEEHGLTAARAAQPDCHAVGDSPARVPPHPPSDPRAFAQEHPAARSQHLPVLRRGVCRRAN